MRYFDIDANGRELFGDFIVMSNGKTANGDNRQRRLLTKMTRVG
jgi:hypothetical protein